jgi:division protein CdvB (Snf7/Vps24/ESCRT-III family)
MHRNRGKTIAQCLQLRTEYAKNPNKTNNGEFISSYGCDPATVDAEFLLSKREYALLTGRTQHSDVIAYQLRQAFKPGELTPEEANRIGYELALRFTKKRHSFIVATHVDTHHIHNHIIFNSTSLDCTRKFRNFFGSSFAICKLSDQICLEHGVSIIENPSKAHKHYGKWLGDEKPLSQRDLLRNAIDETLSKKPHSFELFLEEMRTSGYGIKRGKHTSFRVAGAARFIRLRSLGEGYSEDAIREIIAGKRTHEPQKNRAPSQSDAGQERINLLVDIQTKMLLGKGVGYERWAKKFNIKQMAQTLNFLTENKLLEYDQLAKKATETSALFRNLSATMKVQESRLKEISALRTHIFQYRKTRDVYAAYKKSGYSKKFYTEHEADIVLHKAAKAAFDALPNRKIPSLSALQKEFETVLAEKKQTYSAYVRARKEMQDVLTAKANVDTILGRKTPSKEKEKER